MPSYFKKRNHIYAAIITIEKLMSQGVLGLIDDHKELIKKFNNWGK